MMLITRLFHGNYDFANGSNLSKTQSQFAILVTFVAGMTLGCTPTSSMYFLKMWNNFSSVFAILAVLMWPHHPDMINYVFVET